MNPSKIIDKAFPTDIDFRCNLYEVKDQRFASRIQEQSQSIACLICDKYLTPHFEDFKLANKVPTLAKRLEAELGAVFGEKESFGDELSPGFGTAFLVSPRLVLTAAHCFCLSNNEICQPLVTMTRLIFGFNTKLGQTSFTFAKKDVYQIKKVVSHLYGRIKRQGNYSEWNDWALLELDCEVEGRTPLDLNFNQKVADKIQLYMLGHPYGIPLKLTKEGSVKKNNHSDFFGCDLMAFQGNSGSPVFDQATGKVIGILASGHKDYEVTSDYRGTKEKRVQIHRVTDFEVAQIGYEQCQRISMLRFLAEYLDPHQKSPVSKTAIIEALKRNYQSKSMLIPLLSAPMPIDQIYTELVLINKEEDRKQEMNRREDDDRYKTSIELHQLFNKGATESSKHILILGPAGIGKSTFCQNIAYQWAHGKLWQDKFEAIFCVPLRKLQNIQVENTSSFLFRLCCQETSEEVYSSHIADFINENKDRVLFILDGLDEVVLPNKIVSELMAYPYWIITSRSHAAQNVEADSIIENIGFAPKTIETYIKKAFPLNGSSIFGNIGQNPVLVSLCHVPINLELICSILQKPNCKLSSIHSMASLYLHDPRKPGPSGPG